MAHRPAPLTPKQQRAVGTLAPEFNDTLISRGWSRWRAATIPRARPPRSSYVPAPAPSLDGKYTAFGKVIEGMPVVEAIEATPVDGEAPKEPVVLTRVRIEKR